MKGGFGRKQHLGRFDAKGGADDAAMPLDLPDDIALGDQRHQRMEKAKGAEINPWVTQRGFFLGDGAQFLIPAGEAATA